MLSCRQLVQETTSDPNLLKPEQPLRWSVRLHLLMCRYCRRYVRQLRLLLKLLARNRTQQLADAKTAECIWQAIKKSSPAHSIDDEPG